MPPNRRNRGQQRVFRKICRRENPEKGSIAEYEDTISEVKKLFNFARQIDNSPASISEILELRAELQLRTHVDAARRIVKDNDFRRCGKYATNQNLLADRRRLAR